MSSLIHETIISGEDLAPVIQNLEMAAEGVPRDHLIVALISMALVVSYPELTPEELQYAVKETSRFICTVVAPIEEKTDKKLMMN